MTAELTTTANYLDVLQQAVVAYRSGKRDRPDPATVVAALLQAEKAAKRQRSVYPLESLLGQWRLCFTTGTRKLRRNSGIVLGKGFYLPTFSPAQIKFEQAAIASPLAASNQIQLGSFKLRFTGPAKYLGKKNLLAFDFTQVQFELGERSLFTADFRGGKAKKAAFEQIAIAKLPFFAFFLVTEEFIAARGRGGGLALWIQ
ncbi:hypothetical protein H6F93_06535 [Leptolyngbya sp. FACHB-671]|uniref:hypothetical protein n=1 Tax=Leptolyngbya sp. FACHB-671 TaxID=2692812 RepID=UPI001688930F|nr:hypothetical protein [Leptolyngbya sp. FACHB-671]MBD2067187.1 hypothetical protein [Leptolyngbya sp. FACHB-671]